MQLRRNEMGMVSQDISLTACPRLSAYARLQWDVARERHVLLIPEGVLALNVTGAAILALCTGQRSVADIIVALSEQYEHVADRDVLAFLIRLKQKRLLDMVTDEQRDV
jgi:pyrroloquinoline quinone biosynthesis protein D